jgi:hypothetical protein
VAQLGVKPPESIQGKEYEEALYGFIKIVDEFGKLKIYTQWVFKEIIDYTKGEDIILLIPEDAETVAETLKDIEVLDAVVEDRVIVLYAKAKI